MTRPLLIILALATTTSRVLADDAAHPEAPAVPHPLLSQDPHWAGVFLIIIAALFLAAAVLGPIVRALAPDDHPTHPAR